MRASFSSSDRSRFPKEKVIQPLTGQFFSHLIKLETEFNNKNYTAETLDELTQCYAQAVEYYDSIKDQISSYFIFKIQDTLTTKKSLKLLMQESARASMLASSSDPKETRDLMVDPSQTDTAEAVSAAVSNNGETCTASGSKGKVGCGDGVMSSGLIVETMGDETSEDDDDEDKEIQMIEKSRKAEEMKRKRHPTKNISTMKNTKQKLFTLQMKLQSERQQEKQSLKVVLASFSGSSQDNDQVIRTDIAIQRNKIKQKLASRQKDSLINRTHSSAGFLIGRIDNLENTTMESVLKALDYEDSVQSKENNEESICSNSNDNPLESNREESKGSQTGSP